MKKAIFEIRDEKTNVARIGLGRNEKGEKVRLISKICALSCPIIFLASFFGVSLLGFLFMTILGMVGTATTLRLLTYRFNITNVIFLATNGFFAAIIPYIVYVAINDPRPFGGGLTGLLFHLSLRGLFS